MIGWWHLEFIRAARTEAELQSSDGQISLLLAKWREGEPSAFQELMPLVYPHLREVAAAYIRRERNPDLLQGTALVHELYMRLLNQKKGVGENRRHFYAFAAKVMRMILIDHAREMQTLTRGGDLDRVALNDDLAWVNIDGPELLDLDRALEELSELDPAMVQLVEMRYFLGCTVDETAELLNRSRSSVNRDLKFIRSWLFSWLYPGQLEPLDTD
jgi:RNA polymerase sigma factor (TIGR02999 family)